MVDAKGKKIFHWALIIIAIAIGLFIIRPFLSALAFAAVFAYLFSPIHKRLKKHIGKFPSAVILTLLVVLTLFSFIAWSLNFLLTEFSQAYIHFSSINLAQVFPAEMFGDTIKNIGKFIFSKFIEYLSDSLTKIPGILLSFFVFVMTFFYFLKDGKKLWAWFKRILPLKTNEKTNVLKELLKYAHVYIYVWMLIAVAQGIVATIGFYLFGIKYWVIAGFAAAILSFIPILGPYLVYLTAGILLILSGQIEIGIGLILYGLTVGSILDYVVRPYYTAKWASIHPLVVLVGIFGGLLLLGPAGIILGPLLLLIAIAILKGTSLKYVGGG